MALSAHLPPTDEAIKRGVDILVMSQTDKERKGVSWPEEHDTDTGFPNWFYMGYSYYHHYFPTMGTGEIPAGGCSLSTCMTSMKGQLVEYKAPLFKLLKAQLSTGCAIHR